MRKCRNAKRYKGLQRPRCNKGRGCAECWSIYNKMQQLLIDTSSDAVKVHSNRISNG